MPDLDAIHLTVQDGVLAEPCTAHQCRWDRDASLPVHRHLASVHQERARERAAPSISHRNAAQPIFDTLPVLGAVQREAAFETRDEMERVEHLLARAGATHRGGHAEAALVIDRVGLGAVERRHVAFASPCLSWPLITTNPHFSPPRRAT